ncbi:MAG: TRL-like family protein [Akkermansia sp.]
MKNILALSALALALVSCDSARPMGALYSNTACPVSAGAGSGARTGTAQAVSYLGLIAVGDCSIEKAKANGGISTISSVDIKRENILGIVTKYVTVVKGN